MFLALLKPQIFLISMCICHLFADYCKDDSVWYNFMKKNCKETCGLCSGRKYSTYCITCKHCYRLAVSSLIMLNDNAYIIFPLELTWL